MTSQTSNYLRQYELEQSLMGANHDSPSSLYLGLFTSDPTPDGTGDEVTGGAYARRSVAFQQGSEAWLAVNSASITFPSATASWGRVTHWGVFDALTNGNLLYYGAAELPRDISSANTIVVPAANIVIDKSGVIG